MVKLRVLSSLRLPVMFGMHPDEHPFSKRGADCIFGIFCMHSILAIMVFFSVYAGQCTSLLSFLEILRNLHSPDGRYFMAFVMLVTAGTALVAILYPVGRWRLVCFIPQQAILGAMAWGGIKASLILGKYLDGTVIPGAGPHIMADQIGLIVLFVLHFRAILKRSRDQDG